MAYKPKVDAKLYDRRYFEKECGGHEEFQKSHGKVLPPWNQEALEKAKLEPGMRVLDIGCGRGEVIYQCSQKGTESTGLDYANEALEFAKQFRDQSGKVSDYRLVQASAMNLPFSEEYFNRVFMLDIVEHLYPYELQKALSEVYRVLKPDGILIIHTMPNLNYYRWGYPIYRLANRLIGKRLPKNPRERWYHGEVHVNEQTVYSLRKSLMAIGFSSVKIWLKQISGNCLKKIVSNIFPLKYILANDIIAMVKK